MNTRNDLSPVACATGLFLRLPMQCSLRAMEVCVEAHESHASCGPAGI